MHAEQRRTDGQDERQRVAAFDLDHTLTRSDSFLDFLTWAHGRTRTLALAVRSLPDVLLYGLGVRSNAVTKELLVRRAFGGWPGEALYALGRRYAAERLPELMDPVAVRRLAWHRLAGHRLLLVSASVDVWVRPWGRAQGMEVLCTGLEVREGQVTGRFEPRNCHGPEKARRILAALGRPRSSCYLYAYGDSVGDREMLAMADEAFYRTFDPEAARCAADETSP